MSEIRSLIKEADPDVVEEVKWKKPSDPDGVPVWSHNGIICIGETYKSHLRLTFAKGDKLKDASNLFNSYRAVLVHEEDAIDGDAFKKLIRAAVELNTNSS